MHRAGVDCDPRRRRFVAITGLFMVGLLLLSDVDARAGVDSTIAVATLVPYADKDRVREAIRKDCGLGAKLSRELLGAGEERGLTLERVGSLDDAKQQRILDLRITDALSDGGGWIPAMSVSIDGVLKEDGKVVGTFVATRFARASFIPFVWSDCAVLSRGISALAEDVARWLENPALDSRLGDAR